MSLESPCHECLIAPCCTQLCKDKMAFTAEYYSRFCKFYNIEHGNDHPNIVMIMHTMWEENSQITNRAFQVGMSNRSRLGAADGFGLIFEEMKARIDKEPSGINDEFCRKALKSLADDLKKL